ncbi:MAG TPA: ribosome-associated translation inhibitor RaiA [Chloroflexota bacterium]|nr:ribosome-associated translation inhibitor RaiA [Chloroflexota bacterium]
MPRGAKQPAHIQITARNVVVTDALRRLVESKFGHLERYLDRLSEVNVVLSHEEAKRATERYSVECSTMIRGKPLRADSSDATLNAAIDDVADKMQQQLVRLKERSRDHKRTGVGALTPASTDAAADADEQAGEDQGEGPRIVRFKQFVLKPSFPDEAIDDLEDSGHNFFVFLNAETEQINVLYRRLDGDYGLIEPALD